MSLNFSVIRVIENTLNYVDPRLMNHGKRVAYLTYKALEQLGTYDETMVRRMTILGLLHDIGAYKTEDISNLIQFETGKVWEHSVYGYLFIKHFSPLRELAPIILFHHGDCADITHLHPQFRQLAQIIFVADRFDILSQTSACDRKEFKKHFEQRRNTFFLPQVVELFFAEAWEDIFEDLDSDEDFKRILYDGAFTDEEIIAFINMVVLSIEFRSPQTVAHTFISTCACQELSRYVDIDPEEERHLFIGSMLHDLGKVGIPLKILEKPDRLTESEMAVMKTHVSLTERILSGLIDDTTLHLAIRHHEKLDGTGYPKRLSAHELTTGQRLISVTDIFSALFGARSYKDPYPKSKVVGILEGMAHDGLIDGQIVGALVRHYDAITTEVEEYTRPVVNAYGALRVEYAELLERVGRFTADNGVGEIAA